MPERESKVNLVWATDKRGVSDVDRDTKKVGASFDKLKSSVTSSIASTRGYFSKLKKEIRETKQEAKSLGDELNFQWEKEHLIY